MVMVCFETFAEETTLSPGAPFLLNLNVWGQAVTIYTFPHSGNVYMVTVSFQTFTEAETFPPGRGSCRLGAVSCELNRLGGKL